MALTVNTNVLSLNAQRNLNKSGKALAKSLERLSSGLRINRAGDDAAGLAISTSLRSQIRGLNQAIRNANDGISLLATAEGATDESTNILQRLRELAIQAASDTNSLTNRTAIQEEVSELTAELDRIAGSVEFNGTKLLDGTFTDKKIHVGAFANQTVTLSLTSIKTSDLGAITQASTTSTTSLSALAANDLSLNGTDVGASIDDGSGATSSTASALALANAINAANSGITAAASANSFTGAADFSARDLSGSLASKTGTTVTAALGTGDLILNGTAVAAAIDDGSGTTDNTSSALAAANTINLGTGTHGVTATATGATFTSAADSVFSTDLDTNTPTITLNNVVVDVTAVDGTAANIGALVIQMQAAIDATSLDGEIEVGNTGDKLTYTSTDGANIEFSASAGDDGANLSTGETLGLVANDAGAGLGQLSSAAVTRGTITITSVSDIVLSGANETNVGLVDSATISALSTVSNNTSLTINGTAISFKGVNVSSINGIVNTINTALTAAGDGADGVLASASGSKLVLTASDGRTLEIGTVGSSGDSGDGSEDQGLGEILGVVADTGAGVQDNLTSAVQTNQSTLTLTSSSSIVIAGNTPGNAGLVAGVIAASSTGNLTGLDFTTQAGANSAIAALDAALSQISTNRASIGASSGRLESTISSLSSISENLSASDSRIRDADFAAETALLTRNQILQQAGVSILAQSNALPQLALSLLG